jgi:S-adenosylmethionine/arginine decarboxylase-like enzyme
LIDQITCTPSSDPAADAALLERFVREQPWGLAAAVDLSGCDPALIRSAAHIRTFVERLCLLIGMKRFGETLVVDFGEEPRVAGYSMTQLIETSLISGHFANESNTAYLDIFSCKFYPPYVVAAFAREFFGAQEAHVTTTFRR